ncbi:MAG: Nitrate reductase cytochrome c550-type subunit [uncultured Sulfurovum sp.]|uniref:Nitrate reductase cytochrome c550-type subunit n=1 Tax=uncultured Sulfurovum sp. TaxID=269237 RepID=A0A6S6TKG5_9BACT|nr:MAG: Nitrate reductase cytochrome c550-type subunit [uncultured Sulfurovum sp.]
MSKILKVILIGLLMNTVAWGVSTALCKGCHGQDWKKPAMRGKVLKNMSKAEIIHALKGYKNGTYGGEMKGLMVEQVVNLSFDDIEEIATLIKQ